MGASSRPIVGILGGMGPEATVLLMSRIIALTPAEDDVDHVPLLVDHNPQVPSRIRALVEGGGEDPGPVLATMARRLAGAGAAALAMPCNTAHAYVPVITAAVDLPFINMIDRTAEQLAGMDLPNRRVGMLASTAVQKLGLYDHALKDHGLTAVFPRSQAELLEAIRRLKRNAWDPQAREIQFRVAEELLSDNADVLLIACTELSLIADAVPAGARVVDALDVLAAAISAFSRQD
ncbi:MAG: amino acid racemase [Candidatus Competibacterales bacterium]|nr:amino acid racemase [Candidatus Competibacterales bacterium]